MIDLIEWRHVAHVGHCHDFDQPQLTYHITMSSMDSTRLGLGKNGSCIFGRSTFHPLDDFLLAEMMIRFCRMWCWILFERFFLVWM
jgi:hypothetical protein